MNRFAGVVPAAVLLALASGCASITGAPARGGKQRAVCTPIVGWKTGDKGWFYPFTPFAGVYTGERSGMWLFPLFSCERNKVTGRKTGLFLVWGHYWQQGSRSESALFPLFHYVNDGPVGTTSLGRYGTDFRCLLVCRYRHQSFVDPRGRKSRVKEYGVWPLCRYARRFSPETNKTIRKKFSILWRLFRYECSPEGTKVDVLFLPVVRR